jgi:hypothetical protein
VVFIDQANIVSVDSLSPKLQSSIIVLYIAFDISADLAELGNTPIVLVSAGVKSILDVGKTLEYLVLHGLE